MKKLMDKWTIIRLIESGRSQRSVAKELTMNRRTVARYWKEYLQAKEQISLDPSDPIKRKHLRLNLPIKQPIADQESTLNKWIRELMNYWNLIVRKQRKLDHINKK